MGPLRGRSTQREQQGARCQVVKRKTCEAEQPGTYVLRRYATGPVGELIIYVLPGTWYAFSRKWLMVTLSFL